MSIRPTKVTTGETRGMNLPTNENPYQATFDRVQVSKLNAIETMQDEIQPVKAVTLIKFS